MRGWDATDLAFHKSFEKPLPMRRGRMRAVQPLVHFGKLAADLLQHLTCRRNRSVVTPPWLSASTGLPCRGSPGIRCGIRGRGTRYSRHRNHMPFRSHSRRYVRNGSIRTGIRRGSVCRRPRRPCRPAHPARSRSGRIRNARPAPDTSPASSDVGHVPRGRDGSGCHRPLHWVPFRFSLPPAHANAPGHASRNGPGKGHSSVPTMFASSHASRSDAR